MAIRPARSRSSSGMRCGTWAWTRHSRRSCSACTRTTMPAIGTIPGGTWSPSATSLGSRISMSASRRARSRPRWTRAGRRRREP
eukprot:2902869-Alexandrium_andersonii.AAC.1